MWSGIKEVNTEIFGEIFKSVTTSEGWSRPGATPSVFLQLSIYKGINMMKIIVTSVSYGIRIQ